MLKLSHVSCLGLSSGISSQFTFEMCAAAKNCKKSLKPLFGGSRSFKVIDVDKSKKPVISACYDMQHVCTYLQPFSHHTRNNGKIHNVFSGGTPL